MPDDLKKGSEAPTDDHADKANDIDKPGPMAQDEIKKRIAAAIAEYERKGQVFCPRCGAVRVKPDPTKTRRGRNSPMSPCNDCLAWNRRLYKKSTKCRSRTKKRRK